METLCCVRKVNFRQCFHFPTKRTERAWQFAQHLQQQTICFSYSALIFPSGSAVRVDQGQSHDIQCIGITLISIHICLAISLSRSESMENEVNLNHFIRAKSQSSPSIGKWGGGGNTFSTYFRCMHEQFIRTAGTHWPRNTRMTNSNKKHKPETSRFQRREAQARKHKRKKLRNCSRTHTFVSNAFSL